MLELEIPGRGQLQLSHLVLDLNGTLAKDGVVMPGVRERLRTLRGRFDIVIVTADTHGVADGLGAELNVTVHRLSPGAEAAQKRDVDGRSVTELAYGLRIPVVLVDGTEAFELHVDAERLRRLVVPRSGPGRLLRALGTLVRS